MRVLVIDDEEKLVKYLKKGLEEKGFIVDFCLNGLDGQSYIELHYDIVDLILLDWMLPDISGIEVCNKIRAMKLNTPIILLTVRDSSKDKVLGLDSGADDYLTKPFNLDELIARMRALLRRPKTFKNNQLVANNLILDMNLHKVYLKDKEIGLTLKEFQLLEYFMSNPNIALNRETILEKVWDLSFDSFSNVVDVHIKNLRKKINNHNTKLLETVRGIGYRFKLNI